MGQYRQRDRSWPPHGHAAIARADDADVVRFLKLFTTLPLDEIEKLAALQGAEINEAKKALADAATTLLHEADAARVAAETARQTFEEGAIAENLPSVEVSRG